jgi:rhodanese-related sulfurtransferase
MTDLNNQEWQQQLAQDTNAVIIDVRTNDEVSEGHMPNALHFDIYGGQQFLDSVKNLDPNKNYYVYCRSGGRSAQACAVMQSVGIANTYNLIGGFSEWDGQVSNELCKN